MRVNQIGPRWSQFLPWVYNIAILVPIIRATLAPLGHDQPTGTYDDSFHTVSLAHAFAFNPIQLFKSPFSPINSNFLSYAIIFLAPLGAEKGYGG